VMGQDKLIGLSTHNAEQVEEAERLNADYIGFGPIFTPASKQDHDPVVGIEGLRQVRALTLRPLFAIGGIQAEHITPVMQAGADGVAVLSAVLAAADVKHAVQDLVYRIDQSARRAS
jgi:thiamine-phosphate pyrophosphorylase